MFSEGALTEGIDNFSSERFRVKLKKLKHIAFVQLHHRQQQAQSVSHILTIALIVGTIVDFTIASFPCTMCGYANISRLGSFPLLTYYALQKKQSKSLVVLSGIAGIIAIADILFSVYFIILDDYFDNIAPYHYNVNIDGTKNISLLTPEAFYKGLNTPFWYRRLCLLLGLPTVIQGILGVVNSCQLYALKNDVATFNRLVSVEQYTLDSGDEDDKSDDMTKQKYALYYDTVVSDGLDQSEYNPFTRRSPFIRDRLTEQERYRTQYIERQPVAQSSRLMNRVQEAWKTLKRAEETIPLKHRSRKLQMDDSLGKIPSYGTGFVPERMSGMLGDMYVSDHDDSRRLERTQSKVDVVVMK